MSQISVLIVDDEKEIRLNIKAILEETYFKQLYCAGSVNEMLSILKTKKIDVVLLDNHLGGGIQGHNYIEEIKKINSDIEIIMITSDRSLDLIIKSIKNGAFYYLPKDTFDKFELVTLIKKAYDLKKIKEEHQLLSDAYSVLQDNQLKWEMISESSNIEDIKNKLERLAKIQGTNSILLLGENGVGKIELAKYFYEQLRRIDKFRPFFKIKAQTISVEKFKSIFYGSNKNKGIIEISNSSVVLIDDIDRLHFDVQDLLLSLLKDTTLTVSNGLKKENKLMFIFTSSCDLKKLVEAGSFNDELYYELSSLTFNVRPLRERKEDILQLIKHYTTKFSQNMAIDFPELPELIQSLLLRYPWPGNVPEVQAVLEKLFVLGYEDGEYNINELPEKLLAQKYDLCPSVNSGSVAMLGEIIEGPAAYREKIIMCKRLVIESCLKKHNYVVSVAAKALQTNRCSLYRELNELNIPFKEA